MDPGDLGGVGGGRGPDVWAGHGANIAPPPAPHGHFCPKVGKPYTATLTVTDRKNQPGTTTRTVRCHKHIDTLLCFAS